MSCLQDLLKGEYVYVAYAKLIGETTGHG